MRWRGAADRPRAAVTPALEKFRRKSRCSPPSLTPSGMIASTTPTRPMATWILAGSAGADRRSLDIVSADRAHVGGVARALRQASARPDRARARALASQVGHAGSVSREAGPARSAPASFAFRRGEGRGVRSRRRRWLEGKGCRSAPKRPEHRGGGRSARNWGGQCHDGRVDTGLIFAGDCSPVASARARAHHIGAVFGCCAPACHPDNEYRQRMLRLIKNPKDAARQTAVACLCSCCWPRSSLLPASPDA